ncbi:type II toxin-antitoxin system VapC family toxin [Roseicella frigidaeris]|uniref:Ribonuclease VapC n=1 Tax=Roseicella frigidaeris TaxID=2230885 RepID=A0A327M4Q1_9PROT|nr:type II toxin-antitoxin system VapC family toxin [Roseicella frigidaeris]RAI57284.1 VapC toxin family PIN domain ribonuclease [Roseicella frigidaeris]
MTLVIDASVLAAVALDERLAVAARPALLTADAVAPDLILAEFANVLWKAVRQGRLPRPEALAVFRDATALLDRIVPLVSLQDRALDLACRRDHPAYDCVYVALAQCEGAPLVTADARLARVFGGDAEIRLIQDGPP